MTKADWKKVRQDYVRNNMSLRDLAKKYGVSFSVVCTHSRNEGWVEKRNKMKEDIEQNADKYMARKEARRLVDIVTVADKVLDLIQKGIDNGTLSLDSGRSLRDITGALKDLKDVKGLKSDIDLEEQMARIKKLQKEAEAEQVDKEIRVVIDGGKEGYAE